MNVHSPSISTRQPISAAMICLNEEHNIARSLAALSWCEEIVVVDGGSTDRTCQIVRDWPRTRLMSRPFDNFINQKNFAQDACRNNWVLSVDADEVFTPELNQEIAELPLSAAGYAIGRRTFLGDQEIKHGTWSPDYNLRLYRRDFGRWGGSNPHERVLLNGRAERLRHRMFHYSYRTREEFIARNEKYTRMSVEHLTPRRRLAIPGEPALHAFGNFVKAYLIKQGFRDGAAGLFIAWHTARFSRLKYALLAEKLRERRQAAGAPNLAAQHQPTHTAA